MAAGRVEQFRPVTLHAPVIQQVQAEAVPVEVQASVEVADHHHGMMNASGHSTHPNSLWCSGNTFSSAWPIRLIDRPLWPAGAPCPSRYASPSTVMLRCEGAVPPVTSVCSLRLPAVACHGFS